MAIRTKTIEYAFALSTTSVASAAARTFTALTVNIPETTSRVFRSVIVEYSCYDGGTAASSLTAVNLSIQVGAVAVSAATVTQTITNSGEEQSWYFTKDATAYFQTNFSGTSQSITAAMTCTGPITQNASAKLIITYEYDDAAATTRIKTVKIPVDGNIGNATTGLLDVGGLANQIPNLSTFLPEATKVFRNIFFEMQVHTGTTAAGSSTLNVAYNGTTVSDLTSAHTLNSDVSYHRIDNITAIVNTAAVNSLQVSVTSTTGEPTPCFSGVLVVTYEYDHSASTRVINSLQIPIMDEVGMTGGITTADKSRFQRDITVREPGTITLVQSGILATYIGSGALTVDFRIGSQPTRTFTHATTQRSGCVSHMRRLDSGAVGGAGMTLARGANSLVVDWFATSATLGNIPSNMSGICFLNYTSDIASEGDGAHAHTTIWSIVPYQTGFTTAASKVQVTSATTPIIPEANYWLTSAGYYLIMMPAGTSASNFGFAFLGEVQSTEGEGAGWRPFYSGMYESDVEVGPSVSWARSRDDMKRFPNDPDTSRLDIEAARSYRFDNSLIASTTVNAIWQAHAYATWSSISVPVTGTISNSAGGTVTIEAYRVSDGLKIGSTSRTGNGTFSIPWYDDVTTIVVTAQEDSTHKGVTLDQVASSAFDISLSTPSSGGPTYYAY